VVDWQRAAHLALGDVAAAAAAVAAAPPPDDAAERALAELQETRLAIARGDAAAVLPTLAAPADPDLAADLVSARAAIHVDALVATGDEAGARPRWRRCARATAGPTSRSSASAPARARRWPGPWPTTTSDPRRTRAAPALRSRAMLLTRAESSHYRETSLHADVMTFLAALAARGDRRLHLTGFGYSPQGRELPLVVVSTRGVRTPAEARAAGLPVVLMLDGIHPGEVEGKEASLALLRDLLAGPDGGCSST
jgi:hypothetical protein